MYDGSAPDRRERLLSGIDVSKMRGLEMAPLARPIVSKSEGDITYVDRNDTETLVERHKNDGGLGGREVVPVDVAVGERSLPAALAHLPKFDYIVASHVVEHIPYLVDWFEEFRRVLKPGGSVRLIVPDKRFTFDYLRTETSLAEVLETFVRGNRHPSAHSVIDALLHARGIDLVAAWEGRIQKAHLLPRFHEFPKVIELAKAAAHHNHYSEVHCWAFTPRSFAKLFGELGRYGLLKFECSGWSDTSRYSFEFFVHMTPSRNRRRIVESWKSMEKFCRNEPDRPRGGFLRKIEAFLRR